MTTNTVTIFILGILAGWLIEWLFITFIMDKPKNKSTKNNTDKSSNKAKDRMTVVTPSSKNTVEKNQIATQQATSKAQETIPTVAVVEKVPLTNPDDFMLLKGIGPKLAESIKKTNINRYDELARFTGEELIEKLVASGATIVNRPAFAHIPQQAALAAKADWDALEILKKSI